MKWMLIVVFAMYDGVPPMVVPMASKEACVQAQNFYLEYSRSRISHCLNNETGEVLRVK